MQHLPILKICSCPCQAGPNAKQGLFVQAGRIAHLKGDA